ncbi:hypothetical protein HHK36_016735 [Tetracentron sinense]|uniref:Uncharacterized protein n=1 Tax=Tetracentron sinense TaxID=13715 RepID=A0A834Z101_TETSI|nr:hypothetical protein HHK36_016735 [Tetracentron sinense]
MDGCTPFCEPSWAKGTINDITGTMVTSAEDAERLDKRTSIGSGRSRTDLPIKMHNIQYPQREAFSEPLHVKKSGAGYLDYEYGSDLKRHSNLVNERVTKQGGLDKPWHGDGGNVAGTIVGKRNGFDIKHEFPNKRAPRSANAVVQLQPTKDIANRSIKGMSRNWKNSEENEYMWDDMNSRLTDHGASNSSKGNGWISEHAEKLFEDQLRQPRGKHDSGSRVIRVPSTDSLSKAQKGEAAFGHHIPSVWPLQEPHPVNDLSHMSKASIVSSYSEGYSASLSGFSTSASSCLARTGLQPQIEPSVAGASSFGSLVNAVSGSSGTFGQQQHQPLGPASPSGQSLMHQHPISPSSSARHPHQQSHNLAEQDHPAAQSFPQPGLKTSQLPGQLDRAPLIQITRDSFPILPQNHIHLGTLQNVQKSQPPQHVQILSSSMPSPQPRHHFPFSQQLL